MADFLGLGPVQNSSDSFSLKDISHLQLFIGVSGGGRQNQKK